MTSWISMHVLVCIGMMVYIDVFRVKELFVHFRPFWTAVGKTGITSSSELEISNLRTFFISTEKILQLSCFKFFEIPTISG